MNSSSAIRQVFLDYFVKHEHLLLPSGSLVPDDPTLLFTNAGMVPFKKVFTLEQPAPAPRVTTAQQCVRAGGKHNDLDNVGRTARHHTLFEMLGNFSFGDYFKEQAITYAWEFLTKECGLDPDRLLVTYHREDLETKAIWQQKYNLPSERLIACGDKDNFWSMGDTGPCGPCTEIFYDHGPAVAGGPPGSADEDGDRFVEVWNLVFMQYNQAPDGTRTLLPKPCVDTGSGLERLAAVMQGVHDNYATDQFLLLNKITQGLQTTKLSEITLRVVADHVRALACLLEAGVVPSNEGRGYVLRRLLRRSACFLHRDGQTKPILAEIMAQACKEPLLSVMQQTNLAKNMAILEQEELQFSAVVAQGSSAITDLVAAGASSLSGAAAFKLYDTHGLPIDLTQDLAAAHKLEVDVAGFEACMAEQKQRSRAAATFGKHDLSIKNITAKSEFIGYDQVKSAAQVLAIYDQSWQEISELKSGPGHIVLDQSVFYAESGGQIADTGTIVSERAKFTVMDVQKQQTAIVISGENAGALKVGDTVVGAYDVSKRQAIKQNHSATHLLHSALQKILGNHVTQKGSLVADGSFRFDFAHSSPVTFEELQAIEAMVLQQIRQDLPVTTTITSYEEAASLGAMALFEGKYGEQVRLLSMGDFSLELCGGTHVQSLAEIGNFAITSESGVAAGIRRIEAVTGSAADAYHAAQQQKLQQAAELLGVNAAQLSERLLAMQTKQDQLKQQLNDITGIYLQERVQMCAQQAQVIAIEPLTDAKVLGELADKLLQQSSLVVLLSKFTDKHLVIAASTDKKISAGALVKFLGESFAGKGGGKPSYARGQLGQAVTLAELTAAIEAFKQELACK